MAAVRSRPLGCWILGLLLGGCPESVQGPSSTATSAPARPLAVTSVDWCNGRDDDGDGLTDEDQPCVQGSLAPCTTGCGSAGIRSCSAACTWLACELPDERCNGRDDDCDGLIDEDFECPADGQGYCPLEDGGQGAGVCGPDCRWASCRTIRGELCNGRDDDGDGQTDEDGTCAGVREVCNYRDDNLDGRVDEGLGYGLLLGLVPLAEDGLDGEVLAAACSHDRIALTIRQENNYPDEDAFRVRLLTLDGRWLTRSIDLCNRPVGAPQLLWWDGTLYAQCGRLLQRFDDQLHPLGEPVPVAPEWPDWADLDVTADGVAMIWGVGEQLDVRFLDHQLTPRGSALTPALPSSANPSRIRGDGQGGWFVFHVEDGLTMHRIQPDTGEVDEGVLLLPSSGSWIRAIHRIGQGWAMVSWELLVFGDDGALHGTALMPSGWRGALDDVLIPGLASGVVNGQLLVVLPPSSGLTRMAGDGRFNGMSFPLERDPGGVQAGCVLPDGRVALVWDARRVFPDVPNMLRLAVYGCR